MTENSILEGRPVLEAPSDNIVELPGGLLDLDGSMFEQTFLTTAEVRELNGYDEEKLGRIPRTAPGRLLSAILEQGTVMIGHRKATSQLMDGLLVGDREALLLAIRIATYGKDLEFTLECPFCAREQDVSLDLKEAVPVVKLENQSDRNFEVELKVGTATCGMPTGKDQKVIANSENKSVAELNTLLLAGCVQSVDGMPVGIEGIRRMGLQDRSKLIAELGKRKVGPQFSDVSLPCQHCEETIALPLTLADLFQL